MSNNNSKTNKKIEQKKQGHVVVDIIKFLRKSLPNKITVDEYKEQIINHKFHTVSYYNKINPDHRLFSWAKRNVEGELYEAFISEVLLDWARNTSEVNQFVLKDPYVIANEVENGFGYDRRRITLYGDHDQLAEFDSLFKFKNKWFFVEMTTTTLQKNIKDFLQDIARKRKILKLVF